MSENTSKTDPPAKRISATTIMQFFPTADPGFANEVAEFDSVLNNYHNIHAIIRFFNENKVPATRPRTITQSDELLRTSEREVEDLGERYRLASRQLRREVHPRAFARDEAAKRLLPVHERAKWWFAQWMRDVKGTGRREEARRSRLTLVGD